jgi:hypothetical protein
MAEENNRRSFLPSHSECRSNGSTDSFSRHQNQKLQVGPRIFGPFISKSTQRLGLVGDRYPPGPLEGQKTLRKALGPVVCKVIPSWAWGGTSDEVDLTQDWINANPDDPINLSNHSDDPTFSYSVLIHRN